MATGYSSEEFGDTVGMPRGVQKAFQFRVLTQEKSRDQGQARNQEGPMPLRQRQGARRTQAGRGGRPGPPSTGLCWDSGCPVASLNLPLPIRNERGPDA